MAESQSGHELTKPALDRTVSTRRAAEPSAQDLTFDYLQETRRPIVSFVFLLPLLLVYELGLLSFAAGQSRNGADVFLRQLLDTVGPGISLMLPFIACAVLLAWHHLTGDAWQVKAQTLAWMSLECFGFAIVLMMIAYMQRSLFQAESTLTAWVGGDVNQADAPSSPAARAVVYMGAGVYEELLFRLMLLPACVWGFRQMIEVKWQAFAWAVVVSSLLFALAHYAPFNSAGEPLALNTSLGVYAFSFRFLAGVFFATLFVQRGIGIAVGAHAAYDLIIFFN